MEKIPSAALYHARMRINEAKTDLRTLITEGKLDDNLPEIEMVLDALTEAQDFLKRIKEA